MDAISNLLTRGVDKIYPSRGALEKVLRSGKKIILYLGVDPSGDKLHIGHTVVLRKLKQFQDLGHHVILLVADFTGMIGDPTGKKEGRKQLSLEQVRENGKFYKEQAAKVINFGGSNPVEIKNNSQWLAKLKFEEILKLASHFTVQQMIERDMFQDRIKRGDDIHLHEFLYPLMQGYDSVAMNVDLEIGGTDQTFNMLAGRKLMAQLLNKEKFVLTVPLLTDSKGVKIGKTEGNAIALTDIPSEFYGKVMSLGDDSIIPCFTLLTDQPLSEIEEIKKKVAAGENPMTFKKQLAYELTKQFNTEQSAKDAQIEFEKVHQSYDLDWMKSSLSSLPTISLDKISIGGFVSGATIAAGTVPLYVSSKSEFKRLENQNAIEILKPVTQETIKVNEQVKIEITEGDIIKIGKKTRLKVKI